MSHYRLNYYKDFESLDIYYSKLDDFHLEHSLVDTTNSTEFKISISINSDDELKSEIKEIYYHSKNHKVVYYDYDREVVDYYRRWISEDAKLENSFEKPNIYDKHILQKKRVSQKYEEHDTLKGDTSILIKYHIDTLFSNKSLIRDSIFISQRKDYKTSINGVSSSYIEFRTPDRVKIESFKYDSINEKTEQFLTEIYKLDTLYVINLNSSLENSKLVSSYRVQGNHPSEFKLFPFRDYQNYYPLDTLSQRFIHLVRDSSGVIEKGTGWGISSIGDTVRFRAYQQQLTLRDMIKIKESNTPYVIEIKTSNSTETRMVQIISVYPNIDLHPLIDIQKIDEYGRIKVPLSDKAKQRERRINNFLSFFNFRLPVNKKKLYLPSDVTKVRSNEKNVKCWREDGYDSYIIYEYHYK
ncbi:MAG: hypothetical protein COA32_05755 [Fluviicola sp.]|nr:MAG: hypothetical protein COA32_05755 [Fluviicola sp.]